MKSTLRTALAVTLVCALTAGARADADGQARIEALAARIAQTLSTMSVELALFDQINRIAVAEGRMGVAEADQVLARRAAADSERVITASEVQVLQPQHRQAVLAWAAAIARAVTTGNWPAGGAEAWAPMARQNLEAAASAYDAIMAEGLDPLPALETYAKVAVWTRGEATLTDANNPFAGERRKIAEAMPAGRAHKLMAATLGLTLPPGFKTPAGRSLPEPGGPIERRSATTGGGGTPPLPPFPGEDALPLPTVAGPGPTATVATQDLGLVPGPGLDRAAQTSGKGSGPEGRTALLVHSRDGSSPGVFISRPDGAGLRRLSDVATGVVLWEPNGRHLVLWRADQARFVRIGSSGEDGAVRLPGFVNRWSWTGDGSRALVDLGSAFGQSINILSVDPATGDSRPLTGDSLSYEPQVSPVEGLVAFTRMVRDSTDQDVWTMQPDGTEARQVAAGYSPAWAPDGTRLSILEHEGPQGGVLLKVVGRDGTNPVTVLRHPGLRSAAWSADGQRLLYLAQEKVGQNTMQRLGMLRPDGSSVQLLTREDESCEFASWSPVTVELVALIGPAEYGASKGLHRIDGAGHRTPLLPDVAQQVISIAWSPPIEPALVDAWLKGTAAAPPGAGGPAAGQDLGRAAQLRQDGERLQAGGAYAEALERYRESLHLRPDPQLEDRVRRIEAYLQVR